MTHYANVTCYFRGLGQGALEQLYVAFCVNSNSDHVSIMFLRSFSSLPTEQIVRGLLSKASCFVCQAGACNAAVYRHSQNLCHRVTFIILALMVLLVQCVKATKTSLYSKILVNYVFLWYVAVLACLDHPLNHQTNTNRRKKQRPLCHVSFKSSPGRLLGTSGVWPTIALYKLHFLSCKNGSLSSKKRTPLTRTPEY